MKKTNKPIQNSYKDILILFQLSIISICAITIIQQQRELKNLSNRNHSLSKENQKLSQEQKNLKTITLFSRQGLNNLWDHCGYKDTYPQSEQQILKAMGYGESETSRMGRGEWSNDCKQLVFNFFPQKGWGTEGQVPSMFDKYVGLWWYSPITQKAIKLSDDFPEPNYWLTSNLFVAGDMIVDVLTKKSVYNATKY